ncbi:MAG: hypothetical protein QMD07_08385 [Thermodesulfovibrionales bacterium]|nr:hypothetical protein [Thermodesulfovibrionales bacterium]
MGWDPKNLIVPLAKKSIQEQIRDGAAQLRRDYNRLTSDPPQPTPGGWQVGVEKMTDDGVVVTPATVTAALMYAYNSEVGAAWGGNKKLVGGNARFCKYWDEFGFATPCPEPPAPLTISGSETITRNSSAQYTATGCPSNIIWSVSGTGATISSTGLLTAGATACGSLTVTATCPACGTSATQWVRVADAGQWVRINYCNLGSGSLCDFTVISGNTKHYIQVGGTTDPNCNPATYCAPNGYYCHASSPIPPQICFGWMYCCVHSWSTSIWQCL